MNTVDYYPFLRRRVYIDVVRIKWKRVYDRIP